MTSENTELNGREAADESEDLRSRGNGGPKTRSNARQLSKREKAVEASEKSKPAMYLHFAHFIDTVTPDKDMKQLRGWIMSGMLMSLDAFIANRSNALDALRNEWRALQRNWNDTEFDRKERDRLQLRGERANDEIRMAKQTKFNVGEIYEDIVGEYYVPRPRSQPRNGTEQGAATQEQQRQVVRDQSPPF